MNKNLLKYNDIIKIIKEFLQKNWIKKNTKIIKLKIKKIIFRIKKTIKKTIKKNEEFLNFIEFFKKIQKII